LKGIQLILKSLTDGIEYLEKREKEFEMSTEITNQLVEFIMNTKLEDVPKETVDFTKGLMLKTIAGILAGSTMPTGKKAAEFVKERGKDEDVGLMGSGFKTSLWNAVLAHTIFAHASELEDDRFGPRGGTSWDITVLPVTFGLAAKNKLPGQKLLEASIIGLEIHCRTCSFPSEHLGFQLIPGAFGPAAGAAKALRLNDRQTRFALGLAMSSVPLSFLNFGTDAHYFESAIHSLHGLMAAELAHAGLDGNPEIGRYLTYFLGKEKVNPEEITQNLGDKWILREIWVKKYPCCFGAHRQIDALLEVMDEHNLSHEQIEEIEVHISRVDRVLDRPDPKTLGDLQFSFQHILSAAMIDRDVNLNHFTVERVNDPGLQEARRKIKVTVHRDWPAVTMQSEAVIVLKLKDGRELSRKRKYAIGAPQEPVTMDQFRSLYQKFVRGILPEEHIEKTANCILNLENIDDANTLMDMLTL